MGRSVDLRAREADRFEGHFLVAMPSMADPRFERTVVFLCAHSDDGAMGLVINRLAPSIEFAELLTQLNVIGEGEAIRLPERAQRVRVHQGGPVETGRGFVLHSADYAVKDATMRIGEAICLTATVEILKAIARDRGPSEAMLALGYAGWGPGQLDQEIQDNGWLTVPGDPALVFDADVTGKYDRVLARLGIDAALLSGEAGRA